MSASSGSAPSAVAPARSQREVSRAKSFHQAFLDVKAGVLSQPSEYQQLGLEVKFPELYRRALQRVYITRPFEGDDDDAAERDTNNNGGDGGGAATAAASSPASSAASAGGKGRFAGIASKMKLIKSSPSATAVAATESVGSGGTDTAAAGGTASGKPKPAAPLPQLEATAAEPADAEFQDDSAPPLLPAAAISSGGGAMLNKEPTGR
ncbi:hypothetical protein PLESTM_001320400 [Pleodorina starrii]|nr:hypothetical protein PLESTM_001320400 [Pleodorina starrii]